MKKANFLMAACIAVGSMNISAVTGQVEAPPGGVNMQKTIRESLPSKVSALFAWDLATIPKENRLRGDESSYIAARGGEAIAWIEKVIAKEWRPASREDLVSRLVLVRDGIGDADVAYVEWQAQGYQVKVIQTNTIMAISLRPPDADPKTPLEQQRIRMKALVQGVLQDHPVLTGVSAERNIVPRGTAAVVREKLIEGGQSQSCEDGLIEEPSKVDFANPDDREMVGYWFRRLSCWTDGRTIGLYTLKGEGGAWVPTYSNEMDGDWFTPDGHHNQSGRPLPATAPSLPGVLPGLPPDKIRPGFPGHVQQPPTQPTGD
jgi:hypothetical protein